MQNPTLNPEDRAKLEMLLRVNLEGYEYAAEYWKQEAAKLVEELKDQDTNPVRTQFIRGFLAAVDGFINFPALVKEERESLAGPE
jgi:hypothetical protein